MEHLKEILPAYIENLIQRWIEATSPSEEEIQQVKSLFIK